MNSDKYYTDLKQANVLIGGIISEVEKKAVDEFTHVNYVGALNTLNKQKQKIERMLAIHKFVRLSKDIFKKMLDSKGSKSIEEIHVVKDYETPLTIAKKYNMGLSDLYRLNNKTSSEITTGTKIIVKAETTGSLSKTYEGINTFGSQEGMKVLGTDVSNGLDAGVDGDLGVLEPEKTLEQGVKNRLQTKQGEYPLEDDFGLEELVGTDFPSELIESLGIAKMSSQLLQDRRIEAVNNIKVESRQNGKIFTGNVSVVNNKTLDIN